jgi:hypothetical protein
VDRSASYAARWIAKNVVAAGLADRFEIEIAYGIGIAHPLSVSIETFGTGQVPDEMIRAAIDRHFDLRPASPDRGVRPFRAARPRPPLGANGEGRAPRGRLRPRGAGRRRGRAALTLLTGTRAAR